MKDGSVPPPSGSKRRPWRTAEYASLDFEATGLDFDRDRIISFGVVPVDQGRVEVGRAIYELVDPEGVPISPESVTVHGLRPVDVRGANSAEAARRALAGALAGRFLITWYAIVEASFLGKLFGTKPKPWLKRSVDVRVLVTAVLGAEGASMTLSDAAERFGVPVASPHHALDDALVTAQIFLVTASKLAQSGVTTTRDLLRLGPHRLAPRARPPGLV
jgi:DNA polymerase-3 subunit epsilon